MTRYFDESEITDEQCQRVERGEIALRLVGLGDDADGKPIYKLIEEPEPLSYDALI